MLIAALLALPLWQALPAYFIVGIVWALAYLPRSITLQARAYRTWRDKLTGGRPLLEVLGADAANNHAVPPEVFLRERGAQPFTERRILIGFIVNIAFWPLRVVEKLLFDILRSAFVWAFEVLCDAWNLFIVPLFRTLLRWIDAVLTFLWDQIVPRAWRAITHILRALGRCVRAVFRVLRRCLNWLWYEVLVPVYTWAYRHITSVYKSIIQRANREAIADLAALNKTTEGPSK